MAGAGVNLLMDQSVSCRPATHPFFKDPAQKFPLRFGHSNYLFYTCTDEAYGFVKGSWFLFRTKSYRLFSSLLPPVHNFYPNIFTHILCSPQQKNYRTIVN